MLKIFIRSKNHVVQNQLLIKEFFLPFIYTIGALNKATARLNLLQYLVVYSIPIRVNVAFHFFLICKIIPYWPEYLHTFIQNWLCLLLPASMQTSCLLWDAYHILIICHPLLLSHLYSKLQPHTKRDVYICIEFSSTSTFTVTLAKSFSKSHN